MGEDLFPTEGAWHQDYTGRLMQVIVHGEEDDSPEVARFEGKTAGFDLDGWNPLAMQPSEAPQDRSGSYDDPVADDMGNTERPMDPTNWNDAADDMDQED